MLAESRKVYIFRIDGGPMYFMDNYYTLPEVAKTAASLVATRLFNPGAMLIRRPFYLRGGVRVKFGAGFTTGYRCRIETFGTREETAPKLVFGKNVHIGDNVHIAAAERIEIGDNCLFASKVLVTDLDHGDYAGEGDEVASPDSDPNTRPLCTSPVRIGKNVWLGDNVCVLKGVTIGDGCIIGANSVVTRDIPPATIAAGAPARPLKRYDEAVKKWVKA